MGKLLQIGITGGIGSGKSTVVKIFQCFGVNTYDADSRAKEVMTTDGILVNKITKEFGNLSYNLDGTLNRSYLANAVFQNPEKLKKLNSIVHPRVALDYQQWLEDQQKGENKYVLKEAALLFESGSYQTLDKIIVVTAPRQLRVERVKKRDKRSLEEISNIMDKQMNEEELLRKSDYQIINDEKKSIILQAVELDHIFSSL